MKTVDSSRFYSDMRRETGSFPLFAHFELTYRCNLRCVHCYCSGLDRRDDELKTEEVKAILDGLKARGCLGITLSGGEPLLRGDFLEIYAYAKSLGFIISIFTNGQLFTPGIIRHLVMSPPYSIEVTLNGISGGVYEEVSQVKGSFSRAMNVIGLLAKSGLPLIIKTNLLKQNMQEVAQIKSWTEYLLGRPKTGHRFKYDPYIHPRLNGDKTPLKFRLSFKDIRKAIGKDPDMLAEHRSEMCKSFPRLKLSRDRLYHCGSPVQQAFINPFGRLKFCQFTEKFSLDIRKGLPDTGPSGLFPQIREEIFATSSSCRTCDSRVLCQWCPAKAFLETGDEEAPIPYYCTMAREITRQTHKARREAALV